MTDTAPDRTEVLTGSAATPTDGSELGVELKRIRTEVLHLTGPRMAEWLGVATVDDSGKPTSTGKALVSRFERGARRPDATVLEQYARAPGVDAERLRRLWDQQADAGPDLVAGHEVEDRPDDRPAVDSEDHSGADGPTERRWPYPRGMTAAIIAVVVALAGVGTWWLVRDDDTTPTAQLTSPVPGVSLVFDALGVTSDQTIQVYPGYGTTTEDKTPAGQYQNGQRAAVVCFVKGRVVASHPEAGERSARSDVWFRIVDDKGHLSYATQTYARISPTTATVPPCEGQPAG